MKQIIYNNDNLIDIDIDEVVTRTKALIINSKNEIILGYSYKTYQFPGGHVKANEQINECLIREVLEETGIDISDFELTPFVFLAHYCKNYQDSGKNRKNTIYYYLLKTDEEINLDNTNYDDLELKGNYELLSVNLNDIEKLLIDSIPDNPVNEIIVNEMLNVIKIYKEENSLKN